MSFCVSAALLSSVAEPIAVVVAMLHYPDVMKKAQAELDSVVGPHRLPGFADYENLPYIQAVIRETLR